MLVGQQCARREYDEHGQRLVLDERRCFVDRRYCHEHGRRGIDGDRLCHVHRPPLQRWRQFGRHQFRGQ